MYVQEPTSTFLDGITINDVAETSYDDLFKHAELVGKFCGVQDCVRMTTLQLLDQLREHDEKTAKESLQALPLALQAGESIGYFYNIKVNMPGIWSAALLHDLGKIAVPKSVIDKSNEGKSWTNEDIKIMKIHPFAGATIIRKGGLSEEVARPVEEHHNRQLGSSNYGRNPHLNNDERIVRDAVASADFTDAALNRTNTRNAHLSRSQREQEVASDIHFIFEDYTDSESIASVVTQRLLRVA